jgi:hypothetical protein
VYRCSKLATTKALEETSTTLQQKYACALCAHHKVVEKVTDSPILPNAHIRPTLSHHLAARACGRNRDHRPARRVGDGQAMRLLRNVRVVLAHLRRHVAAALHDRRDRHAGLCEAGDGRMAKAVERKPWNVRCGAGGVELLTQARFAHRPIRIEQVLFHAEGKEEVLRASAAEFAGTLNQTLERPNTAGLADGDLAAAIAVLAVEAIHPDDLVREVDVADADGTHLVRAEAEMHGHQRVPPDRRPGRVAARDNQEAVLLIRRESALALWLDRLKRHIAGIELALLRPEPGHLHQPFQHAELRVDLLASGRRRDPGRVLAVTDATHEALADGAAALVFDDVTGVDLFQGQLAEEGAKSFEIVLVVTKGSLADEPGSAGIGGGCARFEECRCCLGKAHLRRNSTGEQ